MKKIGNAVYMHRLSIEKLGVPMYMVHAFVKKMTEIGFFDWNIIKWDKKNKKVTGINAINWDKDHEPEIVKTVIYDHRMRSVKQLKGRGQIYHHKWMFVDEDYPFFDVDESRARTEWINTVVKKHPNYDSHKIGYKAYWEKLISEVEPFSYIKKDNGDKTETPSVTTPI